MVWIWVAGIWVTLGLGASAGVVRAIRLANRRAAVPPTERNIVADLGPDPGRPAPRALRALPTAAESETAPGKPVRATRH